MGEGKRFTDRYPETQGQTLWCAECGSACRADELDWSQRCPQCVAWWRENPPPGEEESDGDDPA